MEYLVTAFDSLVNFERWNLNKAVPAAVNSVKRLLGDTEVLRKEQMTAPGQTFLRGWMGTGSQGYGII